MEKSETNGHLESSSGSRRAGKPNDAMQIPVATLSESARDSVLRTAQALLIEGGSQSFEALSQALRVQLGSDFHISGASRYLRHWLDHHEKIETLSDGLYSTSFQSGTEVF